MNFLRSLLSSPLVRASDALKDAAMDYSRAVAEVKYHQSMLDFYNAQAFSFNPHQEWWEFAAAKDSAKRHEAELAIELLVQERAKARLEACRERLRMLRESPND